MSISPNQILNQLSTVESLISLPEVYLKLRQAIDDESTDTNDLANIVRMDVNLTSTLLRVINSAFYGFPTPIQSISRAVQLLGIGQLHEITLSVAAIASLNLPNDIMPLRTFWRNSLLTGNLARELAKVKGLRFSERLFVAGLLHDIGHMLLFSQFPGLSRELLDHCQQTGASIEATEKQQIGLHYGDIGAVTMARWQLPEFYQLVTQHHPLPAAASDYQCEAAIVHISRRLASAAMATSGKYCADTVAPEIWELAALTEDELIPAIQTAKEATADMESILLTDRIR